MKLAPKHCIQAVCFSQTTTLSNHSLWAISIDIREREEREGERERASEIQILFSGFLWVPAHLRKASPRTNMSMALCRQPQAVVLAEFVRLETSKLVWGRGF